MVAGPAMEEVSTARDALGMSPRQQVLDKYWSHYRCDQYAARSVNWDGSKHMGMIERDTVALAGYVPPGFYVANAPDTLPIALRRPTSPYHLVKVVVDRFTGMLFSKKRHPKIAVDGDSKTEDFLNTVAEQGRLWPTMMRARAHGGGMGTAVVGFKLISGRPRFEVFDPRWCHPKFLDRSELVLDSLDYRYIFTREVRTREGDWHELSYWYRRIISRDSDTVYAPRLVEDVQAGDNDWKPMNQVPHGLGFCPVTWIQNTPNETDLDGDPDCMGILEMAEAIDRLNSQNERGTLANADPTPVIASDKEMGAISKGYGVAIKVGKGEGATMLESSGVGLKMSKELREDYREMACEVAGVVLRMPDRVMTATEVERLLEPMVNRADMLREQYGEMGVKRLLNMVCVAAKRLGTPRIVQGGGTVRNVIVVPDRIVRAEGSNEVKRIPRGIGEGPYITDLVWPSYYEPGSDDAGKAVTAATSAQGSGLIDHQTAVRYAAPFFGVEDVRSMVANVRRERAAEQAELERMSVTPAAQDGGDIDTAADTTANVQQTALNGAQITSLTAIAEAVTAGTLSAESALAIIEVSFPVNKEQAMAIVGPAAKMPKPAPAAPPTSPATPPPGGTGAP